MPTAPPAETCLASCDETVGAHAVECTAETRHTISSAESVEDARKYFDDHFSYPNGLRWEELIGKFAASYAEQYATKQIERQTPAIIERLWIPIEKCQTCLHPVADHLKKGYAGITFNEYCCDGCDQVNIGLQEGERVVVATDSGEWMARFTHGHHAHFNGDKYNFEMADVRAYLRLPHRSQTVKARREGGEGK